MSNITPITNILELLNLVTQSLNILHQEIVHYTHAPDEEAFTITNTETGENIVLQGAEREAFNKGLLVAASLLQTQLPFVVQVVQPTVQQKSKLHIVPDESANEAENSIS